MSEHFEVVIIGAGASGLMCAAECAKRGRRTVVLDHSKVAARKVRIAGGGRCNFTNVNVSSNDYISENLHFVKSALARYSPWDFIGFLGEAGVSGTEEEDGKMFCDQGADAVADALVGAASGHGAGIQLGVELLDAVRDGDVFQVHASSGTVTAESLVIAAGGKSWPQAGATDLSCTMARKFGLKRTPLRPGLVPLNASPGLLPLCRELAGTSLPVTIQAGMSLAGDLLFTHTGISGPAVLDASLFWKEGQVAVIDLLPNVDIAEMLYALRRMELKNSLARLMPKRLAGVLCDHFGLRGNFAEMPASAVQRLERNLHEFSFDPAGTGGYKKAEVTLGGVDTSEVSSKTMESASVPGLYFIGEGLDVTGRLGGFNLHWAWASGFAAGQVA